MNTATSSFKHARLKVAPQTHNVLTHLCAQTKGIVERALHLHRVRALNNALGRLVSMLRNAQLTPTASWAAYAIQEHALPQAALKTASNPTMEWIG